MMRKAPGSAWLLLALVLTAAVSLSVATPRVAAQEATVRLDVPSKAIAPGGDVFSVSVTVEDVTNLGAFQFNLSYDAAIVQFMDVQEGDFLGSSGRTVQCLPPRSGAGSLQFTCVTLGATPDGPNGSGVLATISFQPLAAGSSPLHFDRVTLTDPPATELPSQGVDAMLTVGGSNGGGFAWGLWAPIIGGVIVALVAAGGFTWWARQR